MTSRTLEIPGFDGFDHSSTLAGGLQATWENELATVSETTAATRTVELTARKLAVFTSASSELMQDGKGFAQNLESAMVETLGFTLDEAFLNGDGAGKPLGLMNDAALITVDKEGGQTAATLVSDNLGKMYARLAPQCVRKSVWVVAPSCIPELLGMSIAVGTGGSHLRLMNETNGSFNIFGRPVIISEKCQQLGTTGDVILADWSQYAIGMRREISLDSSIHRYWSTDAVALRCIMRVDGQGTWGSAVTPKNGTDTLSWCVALQTRS